MSIFISDNVYIRQTVSTIPVLITCISFPIFTCNVYSGQSLFPCLITSTSIFIALIIDSNLTFTFISNRELVSISF